MSILQQQQHPHACECGSPASRVRNMTPRHTDGALGQYARLRICTACKRNWVTVELRQADVAELRRLAYLGYLASARASTRANQPQGAIQP